MKRGGRKKLNAILRVLEFISAPDEQRNDRSALTLLALANLSLKTDWADASAPLRRITEMMDWMRDEFGVVYAPNTRETIRRQTVHQFIQMGLVVENPDDPSRPINSPKWCYQLTPAALDLLQKIEGPEWSGALAKFQDYQANLNRLTERHRDLPRETVRLPDGTTIELSAGGQNVLIRGIIEKFCPRFVRQPRVLLLGDASAEGELQDTAFLAELGLRLPERHKKPDVLVHDGDRNWLIVVEAVTSHGPINLKRRNELLDLLANSKAGLVLVTAFPDRTTFARFQKEIAWETDVWIADTPDHLIHFNGERFLGPYSE